jgi:hypothetical protein
MQDTEYKEGVEAQKQQKKSSRESEVCTIEVVVRVKLSFVPIK